MKYLHSQRGQSALILVMIMLVALAVGLAVAQRSINDVSISTKTEQASRAFSAAEAGIERALGEPTTVGTISLGKENFGNESTANVNFSPELPSPNQAIGLPHTNKSEFAQFWLANPDTLTPFYNPASKQIQVYFGNNKDATSRNLTPGVEDRPAIEINIITKGSDGKFSSQRRFYDSKFSRTNQTNENEGFISPDYTNTGASFHCSESGNLEPEIPGDRLNQTIDNPTFFCRVTESFTGVPIMIRVRILYSKGDQAVAIAPATGCTSDCSFPPQIRVYTSTGVSGESQRTLKVFETKKVLPSFLDFVLMSSGPIQKSN